MKPEFIAIAGGSGSGKSTVSYLLVDRDPERFEVINLDDYQKPRGDISLPKLNGVINWDHPDAISWDQLLRDMQNIKEGRAVSIEINSWAHRSNPKYFQHWKLKPRKISAKPIIIIEGYLALYNKEVNALYDRTYYLKLDAASRHWRRDKAAVLSDDEYLMNVLEPMHQKYVEPTRLAADKVIDVTDLSAEDVYEIIHNDLNE